MLFIFGYWKWFWNFSSWDHIFVYFFIIIWARSFILFGIIPLFKAKKTRKIYASTGHLIYESTGYLNNVYIVVIFISWNCINGFRCWIILDIHQQHPPLWLNWHHVSTSLRSDALSSWNNFTTLIWTMDRHLHKILHINRHLLLGTDRRWCFLSQLSSRILAICTFLNLSSYSCVPIVPCSHSFPFSIWNFLLWSYVRWSCVPSLFLYFFHLLVTVFVTIDSRFFSRM